MDNSAAPDLSDWLDAINAALGTDFELDEPGRLFLEFEGDLRVGVDFPDGARSYDIYAPIGLLNAAAELPRLMAALQLNLYQRATAGGVIGLDVTSGVFVYSFSFPVAHSSPSILAHQIDHFVTHARRLRKELEQAAGAPDEAEIEALAENLGLVREDAVEAYEADDQLDDPPQPAGPGPMIRV